MKKLLLISSIIFSCLCASAQLPKPVAYYPFDGDAKDVVGGIDGVVNGAKLNKDRLGNKEAAYYFNGADSYIITDKEVTDAINEWTMTAWVRPESLDQLGTIVMNGYDDDKTGNGYAMIIGDGKSGAGNVFGGVLCGIEPQSSETKFDKPDIWYHVAMVREAGLVKYYINGIQTKFESKTEPLVPSGNLVIGSSTGIRFWQGDIDEVKIFDVALSSDQILFDAGGSTLPLHLLSFTGNKQNNDAVLQWRTDNEINMSNYEVQRSEDGTNFISIGSVVAGSNNYSLMDRNIADSRAIVYYRLKSNDIDGHFSYSPVLRMVFNGNIKHLNVYPNPAAEYVQFDFTSKRQNISVVLFNSAGKQIMQTVLPNQAPMQLNINRLPAGKYYVKISDGERTENGNFIKQ